MASIDGFGYMRIQDRSKDVIKSGGEWISSIQLENAAMGHPKVNCTTQQLLLVGSLMLFVGFCLHPLDAMTWHHCVVGSTLCSTLCTLACMVNFTRCLESHRVSGLGVEGAL